jgi:hypothetical protein
MARRDMSGLLAFNDDMQEFAGEGLAGMIKRRDPSQIVIGTEDALSSDEQIELEECEGAIDRGIKAFFEAGQALARIRDLRLYRVEYRTFEDYCQQRWRMERAHAYRLVEAAAVYGNLSPMGDILPANERQIRPLTRLDPDQQREAWEQAALTAPNGRITAAHVDRVANDLYPRERGPGPAPALPAPAEMPADLTPEQHEIRRLQQAEQALRAAYDAAIERAQDAERRLETTRQALEAMRRRAIEAETQLEVEQRKVEQLQKGETT